MHTDNLRTGHVAPSASQRFSHILHVKERTCRRVLPRTAECPLAVLCIVSSSILALDYTLVIDVAPAVLKHVVCALIVLRDAGTDMVRCNNVVGSDALTEHDGRTLPPVVAHSAEEVDSTPNITILIVTIGLVASRRCSRTICRTTRSICVLIALESNVLHHSILCTVIESHSLSTRVGIATLNLILRIAVVKREVLEVAVACTTAQLQSRGIAYAVDERVVIDDRLILALSYD